MRASEARKQSKKIISDKAKAKRAANRKASREQKRHYKSGYELASKKNGYLFKAILGEIEAAAKAGKTSCVIREAGSGRTPQGSISQFSLGEYTASQERLVKLGYKAEVKHRSYYEPDADYIGDTFKWVELHVNWSK